VLWQQRKPHWVSSSFGAIIFVASWQALFLGDEAKRCRGSSFIHPSLPFYVWRWSVNLSVPFQSAMPLDTQPSGVLRSPNSLSNFSQLALSSNLAAASESLLMHSSTESFICEKLKYPASNLCSVLTGEVPMLTKGKQHVETFCFSKSQWNNAHCSIFIFWQLLQCGPNNQNLTPCRFTRQPPCFECALQLPTFCPYCSLMHRQASPSQHWNSKTLP